jgi:hypothetical protein
VGWPSRAGRVLCSVGSLLARAIHCCSRRGRVVRGARVGGGLRVAGCGLRSRWTAAGQVMYPFATRQTSALCVYNGRQACWRRAKRAPNGWSESTEGAGVIVLAAVARNRLQVPMALRVLGTASATLLGMDGPAARVLARGARQEGGGVRLGSARVQADAVDAGRTSSKIAMHLLQAVILRHRPCALQTPAWRRLRVKAITSGRGVTCSKHSPSVLIRPPHRLLRLLMGHAIASACGARLIN